MIGLIQLVSHGNVKINSSIVGQIDRGIVALIGIEKTDTDKTAERLFERIVSYRIFQDKQGKSNLSLKDVNGGLLLVPQFTLVADTKSGTRPGYSIGMDSVEGKKLFEYLVSYAKNQFTEVVAGQFGSYMQVSLCNDGPMTFILKV